MALVKRIRVLLIVVAGVVTGLVCAGFLGSGTPAASAGQPPARFTPRDDPPDTKGKTGQKKGGSRRKGGGSGQDQQAQPKKKTSADAEVKKPATKKIIRWGQRRNETDAQYDKRYARLLKRVKQDKRNDESDGTFAGEDGSEARLWTYTGYPFIVRTDISPEFTADTTMYLEMLHREYGLAYKTILGEAAKVKEPIEVIIFADRITYMRNGGSPGSGGFFNPLPFVLGDRGPHWPAKHFRLVQFTDGIADFAKWPKGTLKHEAAHMELQLRLGYTLKGTGEKIGYPVDCPTWWNEGHATVFEYWDFDKTVEENFAEIPNRGRYAPVIRRIFSTDKWKPFHYVWEIDPATWHGDMTSEQGFLNYAQSWSLVAYMMHEGVNGRSDFRKIFGLSQRVGVDQQTTAKGDRKIAWDQKFPTEDQAKLEKNWEKWVAENVPRDKRVPEEDFMLKRQGYKAEVIDRLEPYSGDEMKAVREWYEKEVERRKKADLVEK